MDDLNRQGGDDQIGVITLMRLMWKWKMVILGGILLGSLVAFTISVLIPHVYEVDMVVENVQIGMDKSGKRAYLGDLNDLKRLIDAGGFTQDILDSLIREQYKDVLPRRISFKTSLENNNQFAKIAYETVDVEMGEKILSQLFKRLQETKLVRIEHWKKEIDGKIEENRVKISENKGKIDKTKENERLKKQESLAKAKDDRLKKEDTIKRLQREINNLVAQRKIDISEKMSGMNAEKSKNEYTIKNLVSFKSVYMGIFYDFFIAQIQLLLMSTDQQKSFLCENGPPRRSSEHRILLCGKSTTYSFCCPFPYNK